MFDSALTTALGSALHGEWAGRRLLAAWFGGDSWTVGLAFERERVTWALHPEHGFLAVEHVPGSPNPRGRRGVLSSPAVVERVEVPPDARRLAIVLDADRRIVLDLAANRRNAMYVAAGRVREVLRRRRSGPRPGQEWTERPSERLWTWGAPSPGDWSRELAARPHEEVVASVAFLSRINGGFVFPEDARTDVDLAYARYLELRAAIDADPPEGWLIGPTRPRQPYPCPLGLTDAEPLPTLVEALLRARPEAESVPDFAHESDSPEAAVLREALEQKRLRAVRRAEALQRQLDQSERAARLREFGNLLLARKAEVSSGVSEVLLEGFTGEPVEIPLDPRLDAAGNADSYYRQARRLDRASRELPPRIEQTRIRIEELEAALGKLEDEGPDEALRQLAGLDRGRDARRAADADRGRLPYRVYRTSGGLEVRAGRSASDNDELTFRHSAPNDIWMHVRESPGSHVVLRWDHREQNPPPRDLHEAAMVAAVLSRARGSRLVPVSWTRRKYVRKPRKAGPGSVVTQRTKTLFVEPDDRRVDEMAERD